MFLRKAIKFFASGSRKRFFCQHIKNNLNERLVLLYWSQNNFRWFTKRKCHSKYHITTASHKYANGVKFPFFPFSFDCFVSYFCCFYAYLLCFVFLLFLRISTHFYAYLLYKSLLNDIFTIKNHSYVCVSGNVSGRTKWMILNPKVWIHFVQW